MPEEKWKRFFFGISIFSRNRFQFQSDSSSDSQLIKKKVDWKPIESHCFPHSRFPIESIEFNFVQAEQKELDAFPHRCFKEKNLKNFIIGTFWYIVQYVRSSFSIRTTYHVSKVFIEPKTNKPIHMSTQNTVFKINPILILYDTQLCVVRHYESLNTICIEMPNKQAGSSLCYKWFNFVLFYLYIFRSVFFRLHDNTLQKASEVDRTVDEER